MTLQSIPKNAVGGAIRLIRIPVDGAVSVASRVGAGESASIVVDRADATVRGLAGTLLRNGELQEDARRRAEAASKRAEAVDLEAEAELRRERGERSAEREEQEAER